MGCNKNEDCLRLANSVYPGYQGEINNEVSKITSELDNVISELNVGTTMILKFKKFVEQENNFGRKKIE